MRRYLAVAISVALCAVSALVGVALAAPTATLTTSLTGAEERPGPGDPDATGSSTVTLSRPSDRQICVSINWSSVNDGTTGDAVTMAHIHEAPAGSPGPIVFTIFSGQSFPNTGSHSMCGPASPKLINAIRNHSTDYYVNLHSTDFPAGAIRGQLGD